MSFKDEFIKDSLNDARVLVIYHREDNDGACSAGIIDAFLRKFANPSDMLVVRMLGVNYADLSRYWTEFDEANRSTGIPEKMPHMMKWKNSFDAVFMVDISFNEPAAMCVLYEWFGDMFIWCDHHKPIIELSNDFSFGKANGIRRTDQSALLNTWDFMCEMFGIPDIKASDEMIKLSDYDSWAWTRKPEYDNEQARESLFDLNVGITHKSNLNPKWFSDWVGAWLTSWLKSWGICGNEAAAVHFNTALHAQEFGHQVRELDKKRIDRAVRSNGDTTWHLRNGEKVCVMFTTEKMNSQQFEALEDKTVRHGSVIKYDAKNKKWTASLYNFDNEDEFECGEYLKQWYNGVGHRGAAGCTLTDAQVSGMIMSRQL